MIHIEDLVIHEFRGIRHLPLKLGRKNFAVCGPNGTGKSGVVDAIEFVLTGTISRLTGKGRGDLSVKDHGPHVDSTPDKSYVQCVLWSPDLNRHVSIKRTVKKPRAPEIDPDTPAVRALIERLEKHPEIALSRRQIIRYVLTEPGQRAKDIQALLKLDELEEVRTRLQKIANAEEAVDQAAERAKQAAKDALLRAMEINEPSVAKILAGANQRRKTLALEPLADLTGATSLRDGIATRLASETGTRNKAAAAADTGAAEDALSYRTADDFPRQIAIAETAIEGLRVDAALLKAVEQEDLLKSALDLYDGEVCPVCDTEFSPATFGATIAAKRAKLAKVKQLRTETEAKIAPIIAGLESEVTALRSIYPHAKTLLGPADADALSRQGQYLKSEIKRLTDLLPLDETLAALKSITHHVNATAILQKLQTATAALPEPSEQEAASVYLTIAQERLETLRTVTAQQRATQLRATTARRVFKVYADTTTKALEEVYQKVQAYFADLYRQLNADDESSFQAELTPSIGKLSFNVDFYNKGFFPPGAFHSEGHQDSMGLCLYLALMKYLLGEGFTIAVLDDVLMSVDAGHRREVSRMLKAEFPNTQFLLTTHDKAWLKQLTTAGLVEGKKVIHFRKWNVEDGPSAWGDADVWAEIDTHLAAGDVRAAAGILRHTLEHLMAEQCHALRAKVEFSVDGRHDLGDLLDPAVNQFRKLLTDAIAAAETWGNAARIDALRLRQQAFADAAKAALGEQWQLNPAIHYNEWANFHTNDFRPLAQAFRALADQFICTTCHGPLEVSPARGTREHLQCACGAESYAFKKRPKDKVAATAA